jgi:hypothetical protein
MNSLAASPTALPTTAAPTGAGGVSILRLNLLRVYYFVMAAGIGVNFWPDVLYHSSTAAAKHGALFSMIAGVGAFGALGLRYPLQMLPIALFEMAWKVIFLTAFVLPLWLSNQLDAATTESAIECLFVFLFVPFIPWRHVLRNYVLKPGEPWRS